MSLRRRLTIAFMLAAGISAAALAVGSYFVVRHNLLADSVDASVSQTRRNLDLAPAYLPRTAKLLTAYQRGDFLTVGTRRGRTFSSAFVGLRQVPAGLRRVVSRGDLGYQRASVAGKHYLVAGGPVGDTQLYFFFSEDGLRHELAVLRNILAAGVAILVLLAGLVGTVLARRALRPVGRASEAARSLAEGLLETRLPVEGRDEFGSWAQSFNEMAAALETKIADLSAAQARERRFTADVAHELRTPLTALVGEASLLAEHLDRMPGDSRRPAELLIADVGRLRRLVEDLMEISRFDAGAEGVHSEPVALRSLVAATIAARGWNGRVGLDGDDLSVTSDPAGWSESSPTSSTTRSSTVGRRWPFASVARGTRRGRGRRRRAGDPGRAPPARLRALLQGRRGPQRRRYRPRPCDRAGERPAAGRRDRGLERAGCRHPVHASRTCDVIVTEP